MTVNITIIGLGKIGTSAGLALAKHSAQLHRTGHDRIPETARRAQRMGAVDKIAYNLPGSVADADIVLLALPIDQVHDTLKHIVHDLKEGAVVMDTTPVKTAVAGWMRELLPEQRFYVGLMPAINPQHMFNVQKGADAAREDLFENGLMGIVAPQGTVAAALKLAADLTSLLGAKPLFMDIVEVDSLMAATHLVPQLVAAGLVGATSRQAGWQEGRKIAGAAYAQAGAALGTIDPPEAIASAAGFSREHVLRVLDNVIRTLSDIRQTLQENETSSLAGTLADFEKARQDWLEKRQSGDWQEGPQGVEMPTSGDEMRRWIIGRRRDRGG